MGPRAADGPGAAAGAGGPAPDCAGLGDPSADRTGAGTGVDDTARLFLAVWPDAAARQALGDWIAGWRWPPGARPVPADRWHLTLHFIGPVPRARLAGLAPRLQVTAPRFGLVLSEVAHWAGGLLVLVPAAGEPQPDGLRALHASLAETLQAQGLPVEARPYRPHVTLARRAAGAQPPAQGLTLRWPAAGYALVESRQGYRTLARYPLG